ncbi:MAG: hypothetical protein ACYS9Y_11240 [Planctomycetota bacterium]|jgi:hypothetical protein
MNVAQIDYSYELISKRVLDVPDDYKRSVAKVATGAEIDVRPFLNYLASKMPAWAFHCQGKVLYSTLPVDVNIRREEMFYFAESEKLKIFAFGNTHDEAMRAFAEQLLYFYEHYKGLTPDKVTGEAEKLKQLYSTYFKEEEYV